MKNITIGFYSQYPIRSFAAYQNAYMQNILYDFIPCGRSRHSDCDIYIICDAAKLSDLPDLLNQPVFFTTDLDHPLLWKAIGLHLSGRSTWRLRIRLFLERFLFTYECCSGCVLPMVLPWVLLLWFVLGKLWQCLHKTQLHSKMMLAGFTFMIWIRRRFAMLFLHYLPISFAVIALFTLLQYFHWFRTHISLDI